MLKSLLISGSLIVTEMNKSFRFMTALFSVIPVLIALLLVGNVAAFEIYPKD
jgi:riboflavin transporter FmnP